MGKLDSSSPKIDPLARVVAGCDLRLIVPAATAWLVAWVTISTGDIGWSPWLSATILWAISGCFAVALAVRGSLRPGPISTFATFLVVAAVSALVATTAAVSLVARERSPLREAVAHGQTVEVDTVVTAAPRAAGSPWFLASAIPSQRVAGDVVRVAGRATTAVPVRMLVPLAPQSLQLGTRITARVRVQVLPSSDSAAFLLTIIGAPRRAPPPPWLVWSAELRNGFAAAAERLSGDGGALVPGLAIGDTSAVSDDLDAAMKGASLSHLTAVSGANCAVVTALVFAAASALRFRRSVRIIASLVALLGFIVLVTPESTVLRAGMMAVVVLIGLASGRRAGGVSALGVSVIVLLAVNPWYARDYGFALSVFATGGLLFLTAPLTRLGTRVLPRWCALTLAVPVAAQLACQPILILLTPSIPLYGVAANLLAAPAATLATVVGLMGCLVLPALPSVGYAFLQVAWLPASWIAVLARTVTSMPGAQLPWLPSVPGALLLAGLLGGGCWLLWGSSRWRRLRLVVGAAITVGTAVPLGITVGAPSITAATRPGEWAIALCDVGQGDAVFVRSGTSIALIDTGPEPSELERCRAELGIERVSLLVLTHWDLDHVGGVPAVGGRVDEVLHGPLDGMRSSRALDPLVSGGATLTEVRAGFSGTLGSIAWRVLWPIADIAPGNDASVVIDMEDVSYRAIFLGDLGAAAQQRMRSLGGVRPVNIVKVSHHGSSDQSPELYFELRAAVALIGVGAHNTYGHPTSRLLDLLARTETRVVRTDTMGLSLLTATPTRLRLWSERAPPVTTQPRPVGGSA